MIGWLHGFLGAPAQWERVRSEGEAWWMPGHGPEPWVLPGAGFDEVVDALAPWTTGRRVLVGYSLGARLPVGLQLMAKPWDEATLLAAAYGLERAGCAPPTPAVHVPW